MTTRRGFLGLLAGAAALPVAKLPVLEPEIVIEQVPIFDGAIGMYRGVIIRQEVTRAYITENLYGPAFEDGESWWATENVLARVKRTFGEEVRRAYSEDNGFERCIVQHPPLPNRSA